jgi:hypothetical protein
MRENKILPSIKTITTSEDCSESVIKISVPTSFPAINPFSPVPLCRGGYFLLPNRE